MNEYEKIFFDDVREKKITATGARHRASRGKRSVTVHHPSDYLTEKQRKELSSSVITFKDYPLSRNELKEMSKEQQKSYLEFITNKYNASAPKIAEMLGVSKSGGHWILKELGIECKARKFSKQQETDWENFLNKRNTDKEEEPEINVSQIEETEPCKEAEKPISEPIVVSAFSSTSSVTFKSSDKNTLKDEVSRAITFVLPDGCNYKVNIEVV